MKVQKRLKPRALSVAKTFGVVVFGLLVVSCSGGVPSERDARDVFAGKYQSGCFVEYRGSLNPRNPWIRMWNGGVVPGACPYEMATGDSLVRIEAFSKVNARRRAFFGVEEYIVEYQATIRWPQGHNTACVDLEHVYRDCWGVSPRGVGQVETLAGELRFEKTERGWRGENGKLY